MHAAVALVGASRLGRWVAGVKGPNPNTFVPRRPPEPGSSPLEWTFSVGVRTLAEAAGDGLDGNSGLP